MLERYVREYKVLADYEKDDYGNRRYIFECPRCGRKFKNTVMNVWNDYWTCRCNKKTKKKDKVKKKISIRKNIDVKSVRRMAKFATKNKVCKKFNLTKQEYNAII